MKQKWYYGQVIQPYEANTPLAYVGYPAPCHTVLQRAILGLMWLKCPSVERLQGSSHAKGFTQMIRLSTATVVAAATITAFANLATAQALPKFCNANVLVTNALYSNVLSNGTTSEVEYHGQFQNQDFQNRRMITATMSVVVARFGRWEITRPLARFTLATNQQNDVVLMVLRTTNAGGQAAPTPAQVGAQIRFTCAFAQAS